MNHCMQAIGGIAARSLRDAARRFSQPGGCAADGFENQLILALEIMTNEATRESGIVTYHRHCHRRIALVGYTANGSFLKVASSFQGYGGGFGAFPRPSSFNLFHVRDQTPWGN